MFLGTSVVLNAQIRGGNSLVIIAPADPFNNVYAAGVSFNGNLEIPIPGLKSLYGNIETGYQSWSPEGNSNAEENSFSIGGGGKYFLKPLFVGADALYFFGDINEFIVAPNLGLRLGKFNIESSIGLSDSAPFLSVELGYFWITN